MKSKKKLVSFLMTMSLIHHREIAPTLVDVFLKVLQPYSDADCDVVFAELIAESEFFPTPGTILSRFKAKKDIRGIKAWATVLKSITGHGSYVSLKFSDGAITQTIRQIGGWNHLCRTLESEIQWKRKEFLEVYREVSKCHHEPDVIRGLTPNADVKLINCESERRLKIEA